jgi:K(+)-stimulated pyrophosphate-energized sodium pump
VGNTTAAIGKGFAIASAALTALGLFAAYVDFTHIEGINIFKADVLAALFLGGMIPVVFSAFAMQSVGKAAMDMVNEVRRQFREIPGLLEGTGKADYQRCVEISTKAALREMIPPGAIAIITPLIVGFTMGAEALGGYMAGVTVSGVLWAIFQSNAGGAWDNAKKSFEKGVDINGQTYYKGSDPHKAAVTGDTVGDPFKDTSGPSMNILIKLSCLVGLAIAPILGEHIAANQPVTPQGLNMPSLQDYQRKMDAQQQTPANMPAVQQPTIVPSTQSGQTLDMNQTQPGGSTPTSVTPTSVAPGTAPQQDQTSPYATPPTQTQPSGTTTPQQKKN